MFLLVTPAHDEADNVEALVRCVRDGRLRPDLWVVVDDRSTDGTAERFLACAVDLPLRVVPSGTQGGYMGFRYSEVVRAGISAAGPLDGLGWFGILDCDIRIGPGYWEALAAAMTADPRLGIASGALCSEDGDATLRLEPGQRIDLPRGGLRLTSGACFHAIDGFARSRAPDSVANARAKGLGWRTALLPDLLARSVRPTDSRGGDESGWESRGRRAWDVGQPLWQVGVRAAGTAARGRVSSARGLLRGYLDERQKAEAPADPVVARYYRRERPREWARSLLSRVGGREDPHRFLPPRAVDPSELDEGVGPP